ncbi:nucleotidyltransferase domain-containing protein [Acrocarpospora sp. B8E8]|uniref:nucleotidyltransferase domain-containing protein n=1 Tax=Acrocarpospora sp. B8E8 TaxID=3153572 RepID=UPI00325F8EC1
MRTERVVQAALSRVLRCVDAQAVILFGCAAHDRTRPDSDIDLLVVTGPGTRRRELTRELHDQFSTFAIPVDVHLVTTEDLEGNHAEAAFLRSILLDGKVVHAHPKWKERRGH